MTLKLKEYLYLYLPFAVIFLFIPSELFHYNLEEWDNDIFLIIFPFLVSLCLYCILILFLFLIKYLFPNAYCKIKIWLPWLFVNIGIFIFFADLLAPLELTQLDGADTKSSEPITTTIVELVILVAVIFIFLKREYTEKIVGNFVAIFLAISIGYFGFNIFNSTVIHSKEDLHRSATKALKEKLPNIYHLHLDAMQTDYFLKNLNDSSLKNKFSGFTLFQKNISNYPYTKPSVSSYLTSTTFKGGSYPSWIKQFDSGLIEDLKELGYNIGIIGTRAVLFTDKANNFTSGNDIYKLKTDISHPMMKQFVSIATARAFPNYFTNESLKVGEDISDIFYNLATTDKIFPSTIAEGIEPYTGVAILQYLNNTEQKRKKYGEYILVQPILPHTPFYINNKCEYGLTSGNKASRYMQQVQCATSLVIELLDTLKVMKRYDDSIVIIHGDHGSGHAGFVNGEPGSYNNNLTGKNLIPYNKEIHPWSKEQLESRSMALLMIKPPNNNNELQISRAKTDLLDIYPTLMNLLDLKTNNTLEGNNLSDLLLSTSFNKIKDKKQYFYYFEPGGPVDKIEKIKIDFQNMTPIFQSDSEKLSYGLEYIYNGSDLPSQTGVKSHNCRFAKEGSSKKGFISYGPYIRLKAGKYKFEYIYKSSLPITEIAGELDVKYNISKNRLLEEKIKGTGGESQSVFGEFEVLSEVNMTQVIEIRMFYEGKGDFYAEKLIVKKNK